MGWRWGENPGCRRRNDCAAEAMTQRNVRSVWPSREHRRDPESQLSLECVRASRSRRISASHSVTVPYGMFQCRDAPQHFLAVYSLLQAFTEMGGAESGAITAAACDRPNPPALGAFQGTPRGHPRARGCLCSLSRGSRSSALRAPRVSTAWARWPRSSKVKQSPGSCWHFWAQAYILWCTCSLSLNLISVF